MKNAKYTFSKTKEAPYLLDYKNDGGKIKNTVSTTGFFSAIGSTDVLTPIFLPPKPFLVIPF